MGKTATHDTTESAGGVKLLRVHGNFAWLRSRGDHEVGSLGSRNAGSGSADILGAVGPEPGEWVIQGSGGCGSRWSPTGGPGQQRPDAAGVVQMLGQQ